MTIQMATKTSIPAILIWRDGSESEQSVDPGDDGSSVRVVRDGVAIQFNRVGMQRSRFVYVEAAEQPRTLSAVAPIVSSEPACVLGESAEVTDGE